MLAFYLKPFLFSSARNQTQTLTHNRYTSWFCVNSVFLHSRGNQACTLCWQPSLVVTQVVLVLKACRGHGEQLRLSSVKGRESPLVKV